MNATRCSALRGLGWLAALATAGIAFAQNAPPVITLQPVNRTVNIGATVSFRVGATSALPLTYQWRKNGVPIPGATTSVFSIAAAASTDAGSYSAVVSNSAGSVTSAAASLTVSNFIPNTVAGPVGVSAGETATFTATASGGTPPYSYQWYKNGVLIPGATRSSYTTPPTNVPDDNNSTYYVEITDAAGIKTTTSDKTLFVNQTNQTITFTALVNPVVSPTPVTLTATASSGLPVTFSVVSGSATVSGASLTLNAVGSVTVRATQAGNASFFSATADQTFTVSKGAPVITWATPAAVIDGTALGATQLNATANVPGAFVYAPAAGTIVHPPSQVINATFTPTSTANYNNATASRTLVVNNQPVVNGPGGVSAGQTAQFTVSSVSGSPPITYQWYRNSVSPANLIPGATNASYTTPPTTVTGDDGSVYIVAIRDGAGIVTTVSSSPLSVSKGDQTITFVAPTNPVVSPRAVTLTGTSSAGLTVSYAVVSGPATVAGGNLTLTAVGPVTVRASQAGDLNYNAAPSVDRSFVVGRGTPVITWATPAPVADGTPLGPAQLNATADVPGSFAYDPAAGTVMRAPSQTLSVTFTPASTANYTGATAQRTLSVGAADFAHLTNVSVRSAMAAAQTLIVGFTVQGGAKDLLVRAVGPGLVPLGVAGAMADPRMAVFRDTTQVAANDNWGGGQALMDAFTRVGAFPLPANSLDAAILRAVEAGQTAQVTGGAGIVLVELYDSGVGTTPRLTNISARNRVGTGADILIAGFTVSGPGERNLLIRGVGPSLTLLGVPGVLADPRIVLFSGQTRMTENDTWDPALAPTFRSVGAFDLMPGSKDAAFIVRLPAGSYTVQVSGADGGTGEAVVEIYELP